MRAGWRWRPAGRAVAACRHRDEHDIDVVSVVEYGEPEIARATRRSPIPSYRRGSRAPGAPTATCCCRYRTWQLLSCSSCINESSGGSGVVAPSCTRLRNMTDPSPLAEYFVACRSTLQSGPYAAHTARNITLGERHTDDPMPLYRLALIAQYSGDWDLWRRGVMLAAPLPHHTPQAMFHRACHQLRLGDWSMFRARTAARRSSAPDDLLWVAHQHDRTTNLAEKTLLVVHEGGFGDSLQLLCFMRSLAKRAKRVILSVPPELATLVAHNFGHIVDIVEAGPALRYLQYRFDEFIWGWSLPDLYDGVPEFEPLRAPHPVRRSILGATSLQVGICWVAADHQGSSIPDGRSVSDPTMLEPLFSLEHVEWHSLQVGPSRTQCDRYPFARQPHPPLTTFADTANLMSGLDAIVTVDTAVCHLAGRLGIPTFTLLRYVPDEKWGFGDTTSWYPSMRLIRHPEPDNWPSAIRILVDHLSSIGDDERSRSTIADDRSRSPLRLF
jgi:hypothetical protein